MTLKTGQVELFFSWEKIVLILFSAENTQKRRHTVVKKGADIYKCFQERDTNGCATLA